MYMYIYIYIYAPISCSVYIIVCFFMLVLSLVSLSLSGLYYYSVIFIMRKMYWPKDQVRLFLAVSRKVSIKRKLNLNRSLNISRIRLTNWPNHSHLGRPRHAGASGLGKSTGWTQILQRGLILLLLLF